MSKLWIVHNPAAGNQVPLEDITKIFPRAKLLSIENLSLLPDGALENGAKVVAAAGGDGTVNAVAAKIVDTDLSLAIIPSGSYNHLAKDLGLPNETTEAARVIYGNHTTKIDIGRVNGQILLNTSSIGLYTAMVRTREKYRRWLGKQAATFIGGIKTIIRMPKYSVSLEFGKERISLKTPLIFVGNNHYQLGPAGFTNRTSLKDGKLCVYVVKTCRRARILFMLFKLLSGSLKFEKYFDEYETARLTIDSRRHKAIHVSLDGEIHKLPCPLEYKISPKALQVIVPED